MSSETVQIDKDPSRRDSKPKISPKTLCIEDARTDEKRKATVLTLDNADDVFEEFFDLDAFTNFLDRSLNASHDRDLIYNFLNLASIIDSKVVPFTGASKQYLNLLSIEALKSTQTESEPSTSQILSRIILCARMFQTSKNSKESGCPCVITQFLLAAAIYAQKIIDADTNIKAELSARYLIREPHVTVFTELPIPETTVSHNGVSYIFHGSLDYGVGLIKSGDEVVLEYGRYKLDIEQTLCSVVEAKSLDDMQGAHAQVIMQVLAVLVSTGRTTFTGALSNGAMWRFYTAEKDGESRYQVYSSSLYTANRHGGLIVELLKDMILYNKSPLITTISEGPQK